MRKLSILIVVVLSGVVMFNCEKNDKTASDELLVLSNTIKSGCFDHNTSNLKASLFSYDTVAFKVSKDTLTMCIGLNLNCASKLVDSVVVQNNLITAFIKDTTSIFAFCDCYFKYDYKFTHYTPKTLIYDVKLKNYRYKEYTTILRDTI